jgi:hypothetical protein
MSCAQATISYVYEVVTAKDLAAPGTVCLLAWSTATNVQRVWDVKSYNDALATTSGDERAKLINQLHDVIFCVALSGAKKIHNQWGRNSQPTRAMNVAVGGNVNLTPHQLERGGPIKGPPINTSTPIGLVLEMQPAPGTPHACAWTGLAAAAPAPYLRLKILSEADRLNQYYRHLFTVTQPPDPQHKEALMGVRFENPNTISKWRGQTPI